MHQRSRTPDPSLNGRVVRHDAHNQRAQPPLVMGGQGHEPAGDVQFWVIAGLVLALTVYAALALALAVVRSVSP